MKIKNNTFIQNEKTQKINQKIETNQSAPTKQINSLSAVYPQNYYVSFCGGRDFQTAFSDFKDSEMPTTVKNFIENEELLRSKEEFAELEAKGLKYAQSLAFAKLKNCETISDIQKEYPLEPAFKNLKTIQELDNNTFGPIMKELDSKGIKILDCKEDIPTFLAKKIFFEGKMYKDVAQDFVNALTEEAKQAGLAEALPNIEAMGSSKFFGVFGLKTPNGVTYGSAVQYSDPDSTRFTKKYLIDLTPQQVNEKIKDLLKSEREKPKYAMMDAWNNCPDIRKDLSLFISENANNPLFMMDKNDGNYNFYDNVFYTKMSKLMIAFWDKYPEHKATIGKEIKFALERYDFKSALGKEELEKHLKDIETKSRLIRKQIKITQPDRNKDYAEVGNILNIIAKEANPLTIKSESSCKDFAALLGQCLSISEYEILNGDDRTEEFKKLVPAGLKKKMYDLVKTPEYSNLYNAQNLAIISALSQEPNGINTVNKELLLTSHNDTKTVLLNALNNYSKLNNNKALLAKINDIYNEFKKPLTHAQVEDLKDVLLNHIVPKNKEELFDLSYMISRQGKYLWHGLNDETLKDHTKLEFWKEYDRIYGTNYADDVEKTIKRNKIYSETISVINGMDFSQIHKQSW